MTRFSRDPLTPDGDWLALARTAGGGSSDILSTRTSQIKCLRHWRTTRRRSVTSDLAETRSVVLQRATRAAEIVEGRQNDLLDRDAVLALLDPDRLDAGLRKVHQRAERTRTVRVVVPAPALDVASGAVFENDRRTRCRSDPVQRRAGGIHAAVELDVDRIVPPEVI